MTRCPLGRESGSQRCLLSELEAANNGDRGGRSIDACASNRCGSLARPLVVVRSGSEARDEGDTSYLGIAGEPVLAEPGRFGDRASVGLTAVRAVEGEAIDPVAPSGATPTRTRSCSASKGAPRENAARRPMGQPTRRSVALLL